MRGVDERPTNLICVQHPPSLILTFSPRRRNRRRTSPYARQSVRSIQRWRFSRRGEPPTRLAERLPGLRHGRRQPDQRMERAHDRHLHLNRKQNHERRRRKFAPFLFWGREFPANSNHQKFQTVAGRECPIPKGLNHSARCWPMKSAYAG